MQKRAYLEGRVGIVNLRKHIRDKVVFLGVGNLMRGDDGAGCVFIKEAKKLGKAAIHQVYFFDGGQTPENYLEPIVNIKPDSIFIVDAVDFGAGAGEVALFKKIPPHSSFSTHTLSLTFILEYLKKNTQAKIFILGIQPERLDWGTGLSSKTKNAVRQLVSQLSF